jgi:hypothetical protein
MSNNIMPANYKTLQKAEAHIERYREIISDPLNLLINRVPEAGYIDERGCVILHNSNRVPISGSFAYYDNFSEILIMNRGVHEPLEEYCFQQVLSKIKTPAPLMLELGAYWAHYSMWLLKKFPKAKCYMVEPYMPHLECGKNNFEINKFQGEFINDGVGNSGFKFDKFVRERNLITLDILHSDIQGSEIEMIEGARTSLQQHLVEYLFISTHSEDLHNRVISEIRKFGYRIEVTSGHDDHTTSFDGLVMASSPKASPVFKVFNPLGRIDIARATTEELIDSIIAAKSNQK